MSDELQTKIDFRWALLVFSARQEHMRMVVVAAVYCVSPEPHPVYSSPLHCEVAVVAVLHRRSVRFGESRNVPRAVRGAFLKELGFSPFFICPDSTLLYFCLFVLKMKNSEDKII